MNEDRHLLGLFLREVVKVDLPANPKKLSVLEQRYPGEQEPSEEELERRGIPDAWIFDEEGWCVFIETKVLAKLSAEQIYSHRRTAERRGFKSITAVAIVPRLPSFLPKNTVVLEWRTLYAWLRQHSLHSRWAGMAADYLEVAEAKLIETEQFVEGALTMFTGFPFGQKHAFTYLEGKRVLSLAMDELRTRSDLKKRLGVNPAVLGRSAIKGKKEDRVWDFLSLSAGGDAFTSHPHLTLGIGDDMVEAMVTVPNAINGAMRRNLVRLGEEGFRDLTKNIVNNLKPLLRDHKGAAPWFRGVQRRYPTQSSKPFVDASINFDLRTAVSSGGAPKTQPRWLSAGYNSFVNKESSNYQMQMGVHFRYEYCPELGQADALDMLAAAWLGCEPLVALGR